MLQKFPISEEEFQDWFISHFKQTVFKTMLEIYGTLYTSVHNRKNLKYDKLYSILSNLKIIKDQETIMLRFPKHTFKALTDKIVDSAVMYSEGFDAQIYAETMLTFVTILYDKIASIESMTTGSSDIDWIIVKDLVDYMDSVGVAEYFGQGN